MQRGGELVAGAEHAPVQAAPLQFGEPSFDLADPGGIRGREVELDAGMGQQPPLDHGCLVRGQVGADHLDGQAGPGLPVDLAGKSRKSTARPFRWTKTADQIIDRICRYCSRIAGPAH